MIFISLGVMLLFMAFTVFTIMGVTSPYLEIEANINETDISNGARLYTCKAFVWEKFEIIHSDIEYGLSEQQLDAFKNRNYQWVEQYKKLKTTK